MTEVLLLFMILMYVVGWFVTSVVFARVLANDEYLYLDKVLLAAGTAFGLMAALVWPVWALGLGLSLAVKKRGGKE